MLKMTERRSRLLVTSAAAMIAAAPIPAFAQTQTFQFNIPAQSLDAALRAFARTTRQQVLFDGSLVRGKRAPALTGTHTAKEGLSILLSGSGLQPIRGPHGAYVIKAAQSASATSSGEDARSPASAISTDAGDGVANSDIVVTGTRIRGEQPAGSSVRSYSRQDIDRSGTATIEQFARLLPENFSNADPIANQLSKASLAPQNAQGVTTFGGASFNLNGLGADSTLTLVNGHRMAPAGFDGSAGDLSLVPLSAVQRIEVLSDGASAIYGADAVAGVVNIITRKDYEGAESSARYGTSSDGGASQFTGSQLVGHGWGSGNILIDYEYDKSWGLDASQRSYIPDQKGPVSLLPKSDTHSVFATLRQNLGERTSLNADFSFNDRRSSLASTAIGSSVSITSLADIHTQQYGGTLGIDRSLGRDWHLTLSGSYAWLDQNNGLAQVQTVGTRVVGISQPTAARSDVASVEGLASGTLVTLPGGDLKVAVGGSYRSEGFASSVHVTQSTGAAVAPKIIPNVNRQVEAAFAELSLPVFSDRNAIPFFHKLDISAAVRYDHYSDFGSTTNPKFGISWEPIAGVQLRSTYGKSFRAPLLSQIYSPNTYSANFAPDPSSPTGRTDTLFISGGNTDLQPATSTSITGGITIEPPRVPGLSLAANYFHIDFRGRISAPPLTSTATIYTDPTLAAFIMRNPSLATVQAAFSNAGFTRDSAGLGAAGVMAIFDDRVANLSETEESGLSLTGRYGIPSGTGHFDIAGAVNLLFTYRVRTTAALPVAELLDTFGEPPRIKARGSMSWSGRTLTAQVAVNYVGSYENTLFPVPQPIESSKTVDLYLNYRVADTSPIGLLRGMRFGLSIQNVLNSKPPYVVIPASVLLAGQNPVAPFDPANASPVGRLIAFQITKAW